MVCRFGHKLSSSCRGREWRLRPRLLKIWRNLLSCSTEHNLRASVCLVKKNPKSVTYSVRASNLPGVDSDFESNVVPSIGCDFWTSGFGFRERDLSEFATDPATRENLTMERYRYDDSFADDTPFCQGCLRRLPNCP